MTKTESSILSNSTGLRLLVREASSEEEMGRALELIPEAKEVGNRSKLLLGVHPANGKVEGACLLSQRGVEKRHYVLIRPREFADRPGVVKALIAGLKTFATENGIRDLYGWDDFSQGDALTDNYLNAGFVVSQKAVFYEADVKRVLGDLTSVYDRLRSHHKIPPQAVARRLSRDNLNEVLALHVAEFECDPDTAWHRLMGGAADYNYSPDLSTVLTLDGKVIGAFLVYEEDEPDTVFIYGVVVAKRWRGTWANAFLKYSAFDHLAGQNVNKVRLRAAEQSTDTHKHAARARARVIDERWQLSYHIKM